MAVQVSAVIPALPIPTAMVFVPVVPPTVVPTRLMPTPAPPVVAPVGFASLNLFLPFWFVAARQGRPWRVAIVVVAAILLS